MRKNIIYKKEDAKFVKLKDGTLKNI